MRRIGIVAKQGEPRASRAALQLVTWLEERGCEVSLQPHVAEKCGWKGVASYYNVVVGGSSNDDAAWYYPEPKEAAAEIKGRVAFWKGVHVTE